MKYLVMECHEGYAVLMDEDSRFVKAANLGYEVGQTVISPVLMEEPSASGSRRIIITRFAAIAACVTLLFGTGYIYYARNYKTYSTVIISSDADIKMSLNKKGKVIHLESSDSKGEEILKEYSGKGKDKVTAANEILEIGKSKGYISDGDTVEFYVSEKDGDEYESIKSDLENEIPKLKLEVKVREMEEYATKPAGPGKEHKEPEKPTHPEGGIVPPDKKEPHSEANKPEPPKKENGTGPAVPQHPVDGPPTPPETPEHSEPVKPTAPAEPEDETRPVHERERDKHREQATAHMAEPPRVHESEERQLPHKNSSPSPAAPEKEPLVKDPLSP